MQLLKDKDYMDLPLHIFYVYKWENTDISISITYSIEIPNKKQNYCMIVIIN